MRYGQDVDICLLGIGGNGHIAFNEPGSSFESETRVVRFNEQTMLRQLVFTFILSEPVMRGPHYLRILLLSFSGISSNTGSVVGACLL